MQSKDTIECLKCGVLSDVEKGLSLDGCQLVLKEKGCKCESPNKRIHSTTTLQEIIGFVEEAKAIEQDSRSKAWIEK